MEQRPLRLGDNVDDYCPRERRITNHVIVALVGDSVRQTRCATCDTEHVFKAARMPKRKKKDDPAALDDQVLADAAGRQLAAPAADEPPTAPGTEPASLGPDASAADEAAPPPDRDEPAADESNGHHDHWPAHRRLIRATLPRTDNDPPVARPIPEFTMHQRPPQRGGGFRYGQNPGQGWQGGTGQPRHGGGRPGGRPGGGEANGNGNASPGPGARRSGRHRGGKRGPR